MRAVKMKFKFAVAALIAALTLVAQPTFAEVETAAAAAVTAAQQPRGSSRIPWQTLRRS